MRYFDHLLEGRSPKEVIDALYYVGRFVKQAEHLRRYEKDIFADDFRSEPTESIRLLTLAIISAIEAIEGPAEKFSDETLYRVMDQISEAEDSLEMQLSDDEMAEAELALENMVAPKPVE